MGMGLTTLASAVTGCTTAAGRETSPSEQEVRKMMQVRRAGDRFHTRFGWLDSRHTFSFGGHYHPDHMGFRALRVINDDRVAPGAGFGTHGHRDMEIISYVLEGALEHKDNMGNGSVIRPGEVQRMSAGTGVQHSEYNPLKDEPIRFLQIWVQPSRRGYEPGYEQKRVEEGAARGRLRLIASGQGGRGAVKVNQDVEVWAGRVEQGDAVQVPIRAGRGLWVHVARGDVAVAGTLLSEGDGAAVENETEVKLEGRTGGEILLFDLA